MLYVCGQMLCFIVPNGYLIPLNPFQNRGYTNANVQELFIGVVSYIRNIQLHIIPRAVNIRNYGWFEVGLRFTVHKIGNQKK